MWVNLPLFVTRTIDLIKQYNEKGGSQSFEEVIHITSSVRSDLQVHARKVVQYLAEDIGLSVTDKVLSLAESDPDTLAVCREARRKPRRLESLARLVVWKSHKVEDIPKMMGWDHIPEGSSAEELLRKIVYFK